MSEEQTVDGARYEMILALDLALHGISTARDQTPEETWNELLLEVEALVEAVASKHASHGEKTDQVIDSLQGWLEKFRSANRNP